MDIVDKHGSTRAMARSFRTCPSCGGSSIHRSRTRGPTERILKLVGVRAYRCWDCHNRFLRRGWRHADA